MAGGYILGMSENETSTTINFNFLNGSLLDNETGCWTVNQASTDNGTSEVVSDGGHNVLHQYGSTSWDYAAIDCTNIHVPENGSWKIRMRFEADYSSCYYKPGEYFDIMKESTTNNSIYLTIEQDNLALHAYGTKLGNVQLSNNSNSITPGTSYHIYEVRKIGSDWYALMDDVSIDGGLFNLANYPTFTPDIMMLTGGTGDCSSGGGIFVDYVEYSENVVAPP